MECRIDSAHVEKYTSSKQPEVFLELAATLQES